MLQIFNPASNYIKIYSNILKKSKRKNMLFLPLMAKLNVNSPATAPPALPAPHLPLTAPVQQQQGQ